MRMWGFKGLRLEWIWIIQTYPSWLLLTIAGLSRHLDALLLRLFLITFNRVEIRQNFLKEMIIFEDRNYSSWQGSMTWRWSQIIRKMRQKSWILADSLWIKDKYMNVRNPHEFESVFYNFRVKIWLNVVNCNRDNPLELVYVLELPTWKCIT